MELIDGGVHCISLRAGRRLEQLGEHFDLVWASGWEEKANDYLPNILGLPDLPFISFKGEAEFGSAHWKLGPIDAYAAGRPLAWIDDSFDESCYEWARGRPEPTLLIPTEPALGLSEAETEALLAWARGSRPARCAGKHREAATVHQEWVPPPTPICPPTPLH